MFQQINDGYVIPIKVIPKSSKCEIVGWENQELKIRLTAMPDKNKANEELICFLATFLGIAKSNIKITHGLTSRHKRVLINGCDINRIVNLKN